MLLNTNRVEANVKEVKREDKKNSLDQVIFRNLDIANVRSLGKQ